MNLLENGDQWYERRVEGAEGSRAQLEPIDQAISLFRQAIDKDPSSFDARWRLMRALYFQGEYATDSNEEKKRIFEEGKEAGEDALAALQRTASRKAKTDLGRANALELLPWLKKSEALAQSFLWAGVNWGKWAIAFGKLAAVRQGAGARIKDYATAVIELDPVLEEGGGYRLLGRLHFETPAVPFLTGWASKDESIKNLRLAVEAGPRSLINQLYLAEALWAFDHSKRSEALELLKGVLKGTPAPHLLIEELRAQDDARELLCRVGHPAS